MAKEIPLTKGKVAIVDDADFEWLSQRKWYCANNRPGHSERFEKGVRIHFMYNYIMQPPSGYVVDHIDNNPLNNQRSNLRICTMAENLLNKSTRRAKKTSIYKGVCLCKERSTRPWKTQIKHNNKYTFLGYFATEIEAALAYNEAATRLHGEFARLNVIELETV